MLTSKYVVLYCVCFIILPQNDAARILAYFPMPSISHQVVFRPLTQELVKRGHEVTVITTDPAFTNETRPVNLIEIDVHDKSYDLWNKRFVASISKNQDTFIKINAAFSAIIDIIQLQFNDEKVKTILRKDPKYYDLVIIEAFARPAFILSRLFESPVIQVNSFCASFGMYETMGVVAHPIFSPTLMRHKLNELTIWDHLTELYSYYRGESIYRGFNNEVNIVIQRIYGPNAPTLHELRNDVDMLFFNVHPIWGGNVGVPSSIVHLGGFHQKPVKELSQDLQSYLDSSNNGVIYLSFGTNIDTSLLPPEKIKMFVNVLSKLPFNVLWKWNNDTLPTKSDNIRFEKWFPQSDLLRHQNIKLFITQGGLQSTDEALTAGVPLVGIPMSSDQWFNVERYVQHKFGVRLDLDSLSEDKIKDAITTIIGNDSYRRNAQYFGKLMRDEFQTPLERAIWWTEHLLLHRGAKHLRSPAANMSWTEYLELEFLGYVFVILVLVLTLFAFIAFFITFHVWSFLKWGFPLIKSRFGWDKRKRY